MNIYRSVINYAQNILRSFEHINFCFTCWEEEGVGPPYTLQHMPLYYSCLFCVFLSTITVNKDVYYTISHFTVASCETLVALVYSGRTMANFFYSVEFLTKF